MNRQTAQNYLEFSNKLQGLQLELKEMIRPYVRRAAGQIFPIDSEDLTMFPEVNAIERIRHELGRMELELRRELDGADL